MEESEDMTARKPKEKPTDKGQSERFIEAAREAGVDESGVEFERALKKLMTSKKVIEK